MGNVRLSPQISYRVGGLGGFDFRSGGRISKTPLAPKIEIFRVTVFCRAKLSAFIFFPYHPLVWPCPNCTRRCQIFPNSSKRNQNIVWNLISNQFWYFLILYVREILFRSSSGNDVMYLFQPGHQVACHLHKRPIRDLGSWSYRALKPQFSQLCFAICSP